MDRRRAAGALFALAACFATATAAPTSNQTALDLYDGPSEGCYYNFQHYGEGDRIMTNEPCLNCTCHNRMLMCYLRVCPFTKPIGQDCTVEKRADQCCPIVTCPDVPVDLLTSTSTTSPAEYGGTGVGKVDSYGCSINGKYFPEGAKVPPTPNKPCEHCYCIRNMTTCVMQECTLHVDGCTPIYHKDVCCPVRYFCDHPEDETLQLDDMTTTIRPTPGFILTTTTTEAPTTEVQTKKECFENGQIYPDGALIKTEKPCVHCYCMKGDIVCVVQECGTPMENEGKNCTSIPPREGQCCPDTYICEGDEITTGTPLEEITTLHPPRRESEEGSGYIEPTSSFETDGSGEEELRPSTTESSDLHTLKAQTTVQLNEDRFGMADEDLSGSITTELATYEEIEQTTTEPDKGLNTVPSDISEKEHSKPSILEETTIKEEITTTERYFIVQETSTTSTEQEQDSGRPKTTSSHEIMETPTTISMAPMEDESSTATVDKTAPRIEDEVTESITETKLEPKATTLSDLSTTTQLNVIREQTTEPISTEQTTLKPETASEVKQTISENAILGSIGTTPKEAYTEATVTEFTDISLGPSLKEKTTSSHIPEITESSEEISTTSLQGETIKQILDVTEPTIAGEEYTHTEVTPEQSSEPPMFDNNSTKYAVTESDVIQTTISSIDEADITVETTPNAVKEIKESTESTIRKEEKASTTENPVKETNATPEPSHEQTHIMAVESEHKPTTEQITEEHIDEENVSTFVPSTAIMPETKIQETTAANVMTTLQPKLQPAETTTLNPEDNEINEDILPPGRIPGEGDCLFNGVTYRNDSSVPNSNKCQSSCKCISSIIKCDPIICSPQPEYMENCQPVYDTPESCCPTFICEDTKETIPPQSHNQMSGTESPTPSPTLQCNGEECELSVEEQPTTVLPDLSLIPSSDSCGSEGCKNQFSDQTNISDKQPEKCEGDKCMGCSDGNCQLPSPEENPQRIPPEAISQGCQSSEDCQETITDIPLCVGEGCISVASPTNPEIPIPCQGDLCTGEPQDCSTDKCIVSENIPPQTTQESEICTNENGCKQISEKDCQGDNCRRKVDVLEQELPPACTGQDCQQKEPISPSEEETVTLPTTKQVLSDVSTLSPESDSTLVSESTTVLSHVVIDSINESTTSIPQSTHDHKIPESFGTKTSQGVITTQAPQVTEALDREHTEPDEKITKTETYYTENPLLTASEVYTDRDMTTKTKETETEHTESPAVADNQEAFTSSPVESETQSIKSPESTIDELDTERETKKPQTTLSEFEPTQPERQEPTTKAPEIEQQQQSTDFKTHDERTEIPDQHLPSSVIPPTQQDISRFGTTPEYIEQSTKLTESLENTEEQEITTLPFESVTIPVEEFEKKTTKHPSPDNEKEITPQYTTTQPQEVTTILTQEPITQDDIYTTLPSGLVTDSLKDVEDKTGTETMISPAPVSHDTESPLELVPEEKVSTESSEIFSEGTESPVLEEQTAQFDAYPTTSIITETTKKPDKIITPEHEINEIEQQPEMHITESSLSSDAKSSKEPVETLRPEFQTETPVPRISESTEPIPTMIQEITSEISIASDEKEGQTDRPTVSETEFSSPVPITDEASVGTKVTEESQICDNESECKKSQVPETEMPPCQGDSCTVEKEHCKSGECTQSGLPPNTTQTGICNEENGCKKPPKEAPSECTEENCRKPENSDVDNKGTPEAPSVYVEVLQSKIPIEPQITETTTPVPESKEQTTTEVPLLGTDVPKTTLGYLSDKATKEPFGKETEKEATELPEIFITSAFITTESNKYDDREQTDINQPEEPVTPKREMTTMGLEEFVTELSLSHDFTPQEEITMIPLEQLPTEQQEEVTEPPVPVAVTEVNELSTKAPVLPENTEEGEGITEVSKFNSPEENEITMKPDIDDLPTIIPEQQEPELPQSEVTTTEHSKVSLMPAQDHELKDVEIDTEGPDAHVTSPDLATKEPVTESEVKVSENNEAEIATSEEITEIPQITEKSTEPKQETSETTPYLVELEEHTHKIEESITTSLPSEETITQEPTNTYDTEKEQVTEISTQKPSGTDSHTESILQNTEISSEDNVLSETIRTGAPSTSSEDTNEKTTKSSIFEDTSSEPPTPTSLDIQLPDNKFTLDSKDQEKEVSTVVPELPDETQTTHIPSEIGETHTTIAEHVLQTEQDIISSTTGPLETTAPKEEFMSAVTKITNPKTEEDFTTQSPSKPETSTNVYPTHVSETQKPVFSDTPPTDESPQPDDDSHFPPTGSYGQEPDYAEEDQAFGPGTCRYGGKVYVSAQQIPRDDPCDFCFCFRSDIICLQQSCPPPIHGCHEEPIQGFCCPRYECPVSMATTLNVTTTTTTTTTTLPPHFLPHAYKGAAQRRGCQIKGHIYKVGEVVRASSGPCLHCTCGGDGQMKCDPKVCTPEPMLRQMIAAAVSAKRRR